MGWGMQMLPQRIVSKYVNRRNAICLKLRTLSTESNTHNKPAIVLGIETSCDDTACGIVDSNRNILSNERITQHHTHLSLGGIIPTIAQKLHAENITTVCENALRRAKLRLRDIDAIAVTVKPGLNKSLRIGTEFAKYLSRVGNKPFIPVHHMQAHALTGRITKQIEYPFLVLLVSGGHCMLTIAQDVDKFYILGDVQCNAPGELLDKVARKLKLYYIPEFHHLHGGHALEMAARKASKVDKTMFGPSMTHYHDCSFSFTGLTTACLKRIEILEKKHDITADQVLPEVYEICAAYQYSTCLHICQRTQRAMEYIDRMSLFPKENRTLVASGGVASNGYLANALNLVCSEMEFKFTRIPPELCTDNGVMVAWNGMEKYLRNKDVLTDRDEIEKVEAESKWPVGEDWTEKVANASIRCQWVKIEK